MVDIFAGRLDNRIILKEENDGNGNISDKTFAV